MAKCVVCGGSGICQGCKGNVMKLSSCAVCGGNGKCPRCKGSGQER